jgi:3'-phosphoadenosine 5'-phosphosulfate sulfotransferase (PAPS reductase)/FAD synthetase
MSSGQLLLYPPETNPGTEYPISINDQLLEMLNHGSPVAMGVSGGKDSSAVAARTATFLKEIGHSGPVILIHSDLGRVEWRQSLPTCQRLADKLNIELVVVRRKSGDMLDRWRQRWEGNVERYASLSCVRLILPWSTPSMRFCTSEMKQQVICGDLTRRFPGKAILSVSGIRREESSARASAGVLEYQPRLFRKRLATVGYDWHPILDWKLRQVLSYLERERICLHEAYTVYKSSRVSCCFCILASRPDLLASSRCDDHHDVYRQLVELELQSSFSFQENNWLADIAPQLLSAELRQQIPLAKARAAAREQAEEEIPAHLLYSRGWPTAVPTDADARILAQVRIRVSRAVGISIAYTDPGEIMSRYRQLMDLKAADKSKCRLEL